MTDNTHTHTDAGSELSGELRQPGGRRRKQRRRRGAALTEFAICLPPLVLLVMGSIETCNMIFLEHSLHIAAYEGVRVAIRQSAQDGDVTTRCNETITARGIVKATTVTVPSSIENVASGQTVTVRVSAPCDDNKSMSAWFFGGRTLEASITMAKE